MHIKDHFYVRRHLLPAIAFYTKHSKIGNVYVYIFVITNYKISHLKFLESSVPWEKNLDFFSPFGFDIQTASHYKTQKNQALVRALKRYLNEKNLIHARVLETTSKFSPQIFETYFS